MTENQQFEKALTAKRNKVLDLELNARYWKAEYEVMHYSLEVEKLKNEYATMVGTQASQLLEVAEAS